MLKNVKSSYIIEIILSYIRDERKFDIIKYNKKFKKILKINLNDYKALSGKYMIRDEIGK